MTEDQINRRWVEILLDTLSAEKPVTIGRRDASCFINALRALLPTHPTEQAGAGHPELTDSDVFTLIGHAELLHGRGETDMPAWCMGLARRIAVGIDESLALRVEALATKHEQAAAHPGQPEPNFVSRWSDAIRSMGQPAPRAEVTDDWISVTAQRPCDAGIESCDDVLAWNNDPGFPTIVEAHFVSPSFPEYTHWKRKPEGPDDAARSGESHADKT